MTVADDQKWSPEAKLKRDEIVQRAADLFEREGFAGTKIDDVAAAVGISKPTLYYYFARKHDILNSIHDEFIEMLLQAHVERLERERSPVELLRGLAHDILGMIATKRGHLRVFFEHHRELPPEYQDELRVKRDRYLRYVEDVVRRGVDAGDFDVPDVSLAALGFLGMCNWSYQWYRADGRLTADEIAELFWRQAVCGLRAANDDPA